MGLKGLIRLLIAMVCAAGVTVVVMLIATDRHKNRYGGRYSMPLIEHDGALMPPGYKTPEAKA